MRATLLERFMSKVSPEPMSGCWLWTGAVLKSGGYGAIGIERASVRAHRVAWALFRGPIPAGLLVLHKCDNPACVNVDHLYLGTASRNALDCVERQRHNRARLSPANVLAIRSATSAGTSELAEQYGVSTVAIRAIRRRATWRNHG